MAFHHTYARDHVVTQIDSTVQQIYYWPDMTADITSCACGCVHCLSVGTGLRHQASLQKLFL